MKSFFRILNVAALSTVMALSGVTSNVAFAAIQGTLGPTSTGSVTISVTKPSRASITNLSDITLASWVSGGGNQTLTEDVCVYSSRPNGGYTVKASGSGPGGTYTLTNGGYQLPYSVTWNSGGVNALANTGQTLASGVTSGPLTKAATDSSSCTGTVPGPTARLVVGLLASNLDSIVDGTYSGTLTLLITPN